MSDLITKNLRDSINNYNENSHLPVLPHLRQALKTLGESVFKAIVEILPEIKSLKTHTIYELSNYFYKCAERDPIFATVLLDSQAETIASEEAGLNLWRVAMSNFVVCQDADAKSLNKYCAKMLSFPVGKLDGCFPLPYLNMLGRAELVEQLRARLTSRLLGQLEKLKTTGQVFHRMLSELLSRGDMLVLESRILQGIRGHIENKAWGSAIKVLLRAISTDTISQSDAKRVVGELLDSISQTEERIKQLSSDKLDLKDKPLKDIDLKDKPLKDIDLKDKPLKDIDLKDRPTRNVPLYVRQMLVELLDHPEISRLYDLNNQSHFNVLVNSFSSLAGAPGSLFRLSEKMRFLYVEQVLQRTSACSLPLTPMQIQALSTILNSLSAEKKLKVINPFIEFVINEDVRSLYQECERPKYSYLILSHLPNLASAKESTCPLRQELLVQYIELLLRQIDDGLQVLTEDNCKGIGILLNRLDEAKRQEILKIIFSDKDINNLLYLLLQHPQLPKSMKDYVFNRLPEGLILSTFSSFWDSIPSCNEESFLSLWNSVLPTIKAQAIQKYLKQIPKSIENTLPGMTAVGKSKFYSGFLIRALKSVDEFDFERPVDRLRMLKVACIDINKWLKILQKMFGDPETWPYATSIAFSQVEKLFGLKEAANVHAGFNSLARELYRMLYLAGYTTLKSDLFCFPEQVSEGLKNACQSLLAEDTISNLLEIFISRLADLEFSSFARGKKELYQVVWEYTSKYSKLSLENKVNIAVLLSAYGYIDHLESVKKMLTKEIAPETLFHALSFLARGLRENSNWVEEFLRLPVVTALFEPKKLAELRNIYLSVYIETQKSSGKIEAAIGHLILYMSDLFEHCEQPIPVAVTVALEGMAILSTRNPKKSWHNSKTAFFNALPEKFYRPGREKNSKLASYFDPYFIPLEFLLTYVANDSEESVRYSRKIQQHATKILKYVIDNKLGTLEQRKKLVILFLEKCVKEHPSVIQPNEFLEFWNMAIKKELVSLSSDTERFLYELFINPEPTTLSSGELKDAILKGVSLQANYSLFKAVDLYKKLMKLRPDDNFEQNKEESILSIVSYYSKNLFEDLEIAKILIPKFSEMVNELKSNKSYVQNKVVELYRDALWDMYNKAVYIETFTHTIVVLSNLGNEEKLILAPFIDFFINELQILDHSPGFLGTLILEIRKQGGICDRERDKAMQSEQEQLIYASKDELSRHIVRKENCLEVSTLDIEELKSFSQTANQLLQYGLQNGIYQNSLQVLNFLSPLLEFFVVNHYENPLEMKAYFQNIFNLLQKKFGFTVEEEQFKNDLFSKWLKLLKIKYVKVGEA